MFLAKLFIFTQLISDIKKPIIFFFVRWFPPNVVFQVSNSFFCSFFRMMTKRSQGRRRFGRRNFRQRYFRLTTQSLSYAKSKGKNPICDIPLSEILAVERLNERSFKLQNIFQVFALIYTLYNQTNRFEHKSFSINQSFSWDINVISFLDPLDNKKR